MGRWGQQTNYKLLLGALDMPSLFGSGRVWSMALTPRVSAAWQHAFGDVTPTAALSFQTIGTAFTIAGVPIARDAALVDAGADLALNHYASIGIAYVGQLAGRDQDNSVNGNFRLKF